MHPYSPPHYGLSWFFKNGDLENHSHKVAAYRYLYNITRADGRDKFIVLCHGQGLWNYFNFMMLAWCYHGKQWRFKMVKSGFGDPHFFIESFHYRQVMNIITLKNSVVWNFFISKKNNFFLIEKNPTQQKSITDHLRKLLMKKNWESPNSLGRWIQKIPIWRPFWNITVAMVTPCEHKEVVFSCPCLYQKVKLISQALAMI